MLKTDPDKVREWQRRSRKPLKRTSSLGQNRLTRSIPRKTPIASIGAEIAGVAVTTPQYKAISSKPRKRIGPGPRMKAWRAVWAWLLPRMIAAGRLECEFDFLEHVCWGPIDPVHSKKRNKMQGDDIYAVARGCRRVHDYLDGVYAYPALKRRMNHEEMERAVLCAIERHGGMILPEVKHVVST